jgi:predicted alpha/beta hydrolase family esterase
MTFAGKFRLAPALGVVAGLLVSGMPGSLQAAPQTGSVVTPAQKKPAISRFQGDIYLVRGLGGLTSGMNLLGTSMRQAGIDVKVVGQSSWQSVVTQIVADQKAHGRKPVILIGHSLGANAIIRIAQSLKTSGIAVDYMVSFAAASPKPVPSNVRKVTNYYFSSGALGKILVADKDFQGSLQNLDYAKKPGIGHFNIEEQPDIHRDIIRNVLRYVKPSTTVSSN